MLSVPPQIVTEIKTIVFRFLWNSKDKIKRKVVCNEFKRGGLRMVDIDNMIKSLKLTWISRLVASEKRPWKNYLQQALQKAGGYKLFLRSNYDISRRKDLSLSSFYLEALKYWKDLRDQCIINNDELIWNNKNILVNNFPVFYKNFSRIGINSLQDLFPISRETTAREAFDFWVKKGLNKNCLTFYKFLVLRQVARVRRNCLENANMYDNNENDPILIRSKHSDFFRNVSIFKAKHYYNILKEITAITIPTRWTKLKSDFNLSDEDLESVYGLPFNTTNENKLREMQFKILNFIVATNCYLKKVKIKDNDLCDFCKIEKEDVYHLFYECNVVRKFWREFECYWNIKTGHPLKLSLKEIILGKTDLQGDLLNYCILVAKQYILTSKSNYAPPPF